ncbi:MAG TPA: Hsp70 family protein, partial [Polyangiales bacterium]|nr:Hsp70 family protein [Polyangiales bacterium]
VVARGATVQAALKARDRAVSEVVLTDVMPFSLGIISSECIGEKRANDVFSPIIERNTPVPVSRVQSYSTVEDRQRQIDLDIRQGESPVGSENLALGKISIAVPPAPAGEVSIDVRFTYDVNGLLQVDVSEQSSGSKARALIERQKSAMTAEQIAEALKRVEALKIHPKDVQENVYLIERAKRLYEDRLGERELLRHELSLFNLALDSQDPARIEPAREQLKLLLDRLDRSFVL